MTSPNQPTTTAFFTTQNKPIRNIAKSSHIPTPIPLPNPHSQSAFGGRNSECNDEECVNVNLVKLLYSVKHSLYHVKVVSLYYIDKTKVVKIEILYGLWDVGGIVDRKIGSWIVRFYII